MPANPLTVPGSAPADIELADLRPTRVRLAVTWRLRDHRSGCLMIIWIIMTILSFVLWFVAAGTSVGVGCYQTNCTSIANGTSMISTYPVTSLYAALTTTYPTTIPAITTFVTTTYVTATSETVASMTETVASATESAAFHREATWAEPANDTNHQLDAQSTSWQVAVQYFLILYYVISFFALCLLIFNRYKKQRNARAAAAPAWPGREERARQRALDNEQRNQQLIDSLTEHGLL